MKKSLPNVGISIAIAVAFAVLMLWVALSGGDPYFAVGLAVLSVAWILVAAVSAKRTRSR